MWKQSGLSFLAVAVSLGIHVVRKASSSEVTRRASSGLWDPFVVIDGTLMMVVPISFQLSSSTIHSNGYLEQIQQSGVHSFSMDVGINRGKVILQDWLNNMPNLFVIGVEANARLVSYFESNEVADAVRDRAIIIHGAVASMRNITAEFNTGAGWNDVSDTGSLFRWSDKKREQIRVTKRNIFSQRVRLIRLDDILQYVPPPRYAPSEDKFLWDTLKVDIQGADADALISAGEYLKYFICVVGEFKYDHYKLPDDIIRDPSTLLTTFNFTKVYQGNDNQIWINRKFESSYLENGAQFGCHRVYDSRTNVSQLQYALKHRTIVQG